MFPITKRQLYELGMELFSKLEAGVSDRTGLRDNNRPRLPDDLPFNQVLHINFLRWVCGVFAHQLREVDETSLMPPSALFQVCINLYLKVLKSDEYSHRIIQTSNLTPLIEEFFLRHEASFVDAADESAAIVMYGAAAAPTAAARDRRPAGVGLLLKSHLANAMNHPVPATRDDSYLNNLSSGEDVSDDALHGRSAWYCCRR